jgi:MFS family permease
MMLLGPSLALLANVAIYLPLTIWLLYVPYTGHQRQEAAPRRPVRWRDAFNVVREVRNDRAILTMIILGGSASLFVGNQFQTQMPAFARDLGAGQADFAYSALLMASAAGAVFGGVLLEVKGWLQAKVRSTITCVILWCLLIAAFAMSTNYYLSVVLLFLAGMLNLAFYSSAQAIVQLRAPSHLRGRLIGLFTMSALGLRAVSGVTVGIVGSVISIHRSLALSALVLLGVAATLQVFARSRRDIRSAD